MLLHIWGHIFGPIFTTNYVCVGVHTYVAFSCFFSRGGGGGGSFSEGSATSETPLVIIG